MYVRFNPDDPHPKHYKKFWLYWNEPPYVCDYCGGEIDASVKADLVVHHVDHDHDNVTLDNLVPLHRKCHPSVHIKGMTRSEESKQRMSEAQYRRFAEEDPVKREERIAKASAANRGNTHTKHELFGELQRNAQHTSRMRECECGMRTNAGSMASHQKKTGHSLARSADERTAGC